MSIGRIESRGGEGRHQVQRRLADAAIMAAARGLTVNGHEAGLFEPFDGGDDRGRRSESESPHEITPISNTETAFNPSSAPKG